MRILLALVLALMALPANAETLQAAMIRAYQTNPELRREQAKLRAIDEGVPLAKSGQRPSVDLGAAIGQKKFNQGAVDNDSTPRNLGLSLTQPLYKGGSISSSISSAEKAVLAARASYDDAEQALFLNVATSYFDVWLYQATLKINKKNEEVLKQELQAARDRFAVGEATRTDVAQADSRLAGAIASRIESEGLLANAKATYEKVIGNPPSELAAPDVNFPIPARLDEMIDLAQANNPKVISAKYTAEGAEQDIATAEGALLPEIHLEANADRAWDSSVAATTGKTDTASIMARLTMPLYRGGADYARTRAAKETASQRRVEIRSALDAARETAVRAWESLNTAKATIKSRQKQVEAAQLAFEGVKEESRVGTRTILDRLNAEAEALQARVNLVQSQRDKAVALFAVKAAIGELTAQKLKLPITPYDPTAHYEATKDKWIGLGASEDPEFKNPEVTPEPSGEPAVETSPKTPL
ncbi:MAG: TolC family outer membrane protein [Alphaproteobacteria bacterium]|nr:TolC family outer membrane protein [Alphaproteobacteria bacterium]